ncbi:MAG: hypothetical protein N2512_06075, partial [Armatimonadetes bacterium]|nr:hypothetical protein [Armatimonadota bacterium]
MLLFLTLTSAVMIAMSAMAQEVVPIPAGETFLRDIGIYRVAYQSYGGQVVEMPPSWIGHFEQVSGVSYLPDQHVLGRSAILLHSPWRVAPGRAFVDYPLRLPNTKPITLSFGIAMGPEFVVPGRSDGVTFSAFVIDGGRERELFRKHQAAAEWLDYSFDLSEFAGREIVLRLQTEPGPNNDPSWDYSYFGDARIVAGGVQQTRAGLLERLTSTRAYRATENVSLEALASNPENSIVPSNLLPCRNEIRRDGEGFQFIYEAADCRLVYTYLPRTGTLDDFTARVYDGNAFRPAQGGGAVFAAKDGDRESAIPARDGRLVRCELADGGKAVEAIWEYDAGGPTARIAWRFEISGKALIIQASCDQPLVSAFSLGNAGGVPLRRTIPIPYLPASWHQGTVLYLPAENLFVCRYLDWTVSHSSMCPQGEASYHIKTDGTRNPMFERGYVAVSPNVNEVLPDAPHPPSPYLELLAPLPMLDIWAHHKGTYQGDAENLRALKDHGVDKLAIIQHVWQRYGYDVKLPDHLPANPDFGGDEGMIEFGRAANECGYIWSLHENYIDLYPDAPSFDPTAVVLRPDGSRSPAWFNAGTGVQSFGLKCNRALEFAKKTAPEAHRRYGTTAAYLDVHTCVPPWHQLDHDATQPMAAMALAKVKYDSQLFQFMREAHGGPLFGEGANHFYWAGLCDGVEAQVVGGENHVPFLDFDLLKIHPQMVNHGMGYYERWFSSGYNMRFGWDVGTLEQIDKYRAQEIAYGHAGFIGSAQTDNIHWVVKEYCMVHPVQALYGAAKATDIRYEVDGRLVTASVALALDERWRQRITYSSGLTVWVNWAPEPWQVEGRTLPQWGFLALGPGTEVCTILRDGHYFDYADCPEYVFADARTYFDMPYVTGRKDIEPRLADFQHLGDGRIRLTYEWAINDTLDRDLTVFVHFVNPATGAGEGICFQNDHQPPVPTSQWQKGDLLTDGPFEVTIPDDGMPYYDIVAGLYDRAGRVAIRGTQAGSDRVLLGRLIVTREGGKITDVQLLGPAEAARDYPKPADFSVRLNPPGTLAIFPKVATDGSVKVDKGARSLTVFPYPREREFTVRLNMKELAPGLDLAAGKITLRALAAGSKEDLGEVPFTIDDGWLT